MYQFKTAEELNEQLKAFEAKALSLSESEKTKVTCETKTVYDDDKKTSGTVYVAYLRKPHIIAAVKALDMVAAGRMFEAGFFLFDMVFIKEQSDAEFEEKEGWKLGLCSRIGTMLDLEALDIKKK